MRRRRFNVAGLVGILVMALGLAFVGGSADEEGRAAKFGQEPTILTLQKLIERGPDGPKNVTITNFVLCENYVVAKKRFSWDRVWIPIVPTPISDSHDNRVKTTSRVQVVVDCVSARDEEELIRRCAVPQLSGLVVGTVSDLDPVAQQLLRRSYPECDIATCLVVREGARVAQPGGVQFMRILGLVFSGLGTLLVLVGMISWVRGNARLTAT